MQNISWILEGGSVLECAMCKNYVHEQDIINTTCLGCRHEYEAHTDEDANEMDYPKPDLFDMREAVVTDMDIREMNNGNSR